MSLCPLFLVLRMLFLPLIRMVLRAKNVATSHVYTAATHIVMSLSQVPHVVLGGHIPTSGTSYGLSQGVPHIPTYGVSYGTSHGTSYGASHGQYYGPQYGKNYQPYEYGYQQPT